MENAVDALKIGFAVFVFVVALTVAFSLISQAKSTADTILRHSDITNYYENLKSKNKFREVSVSEVISSLYKYYKESLCVIVKLDSDEYKFDTSLNKEEIKKLYDDDIIPTNQMPSKTKDIEKMLDTFINDILLRNYADSIFTEEFVEVPYSGIYDVGEDGTEITLSSGSKKMYITYTLNN